MKGADDDITEDTAEMECSNLSLVAEGDLLRQVGSADLSREEPHKHGRKYFPQALIHKGLDGHHLSFVVASGSACVARRGSPDSAQGGLPPPPPFWRALGTERGGVGGPLLSLARPALTWQCKQTLLKRLHLRMRSDLPTLACPKLRF